MMIILVSFYTSHYFFFSMLFLDRPLTHAATEEGVRKERRAPPHMRGPKYGVTAQDARRHADGCVSAITKGVATAVVTTATLSWFYCVRCASLTGH